MKRLLLVLLFPILLGAQSNEKIDWLTDYEKAVKKASKEDKYVLLYFTGSDWCPPCKSLKNDLFNSVEFEALADKYALLYIDIPRNKDLISEVQMKHNKELLSKYNKKGVFPMLQIINAKGRLIDEYSGYSMNGEIQYHLDMLNKHK